MTEPPPPYSVRRDERIGWWAILKDGKPFDMCRTYDEAMIARDRLNAEWTADWRDRDEQEGDDAQQ